VLVSVNSERNSKTWPARITSWVLRSPSAGLRGTTLDHRSEAEVAWKLCGIGNRRSNSMQWVEWNVLV